MYNHNKAQQSSNRVHISWDILYCESQRHTMRFIDTFHYTVTNLTTGGQANIIEDVCMSLNSLSCLMIAHSRQILWPLQIHI